MSSLLFFICGLILGAIIFAVSQFLYNKKTINFNDLKYENPPPPPLILENPVAETLITSNIHIRPGEIGLSNLQVNSKIFKYNGYEYRCQNYKLNFKRDFALDKSFNKLNEEERQKLLNNLIPILKDNFKHVYLIIESNFRWFNGQNNYEYEYICIGV